MRPASSPACNFSCRSRVLALGLLIVSAAGAQPVESRTPPEPITPEQLKEESVVFTPPGFDRVGEPRWDNTTSWKHRGRAGWVQVVVSDAATGKLTPGRVNVVGSDGHYYQPPPNRWSRFALTGTYPNPAGTGGNRIGKAPYRYLGRFFYTPGETTVRVPAGAVRVEVWRGYEYRPEEIDVQVPDGGVQRVEVKLARTVPMAPAGYYPGDSHLHLTRVTEEDEQLFFDMLEMEDIKYGVNMAWNTVGTYAGFMDAQVDPQRSLGRGSMRSRGSLHMVSGQEYRSRVYGHLNLTLRDDLALIGKTFDTDTWPVFGEVARETIARGGYAFMAHGGYQQEIYADAALGHSSGLELLQFGIYRHVGLENWYHMLNSGYRFAAHGASDYQACRFLADCRTYVHHPGEPTMTEWLAGVAAGRSFFTSGPLLLLEVDGQKPGAQIRRQGAGPHRVTARVRVRCEVTPVTDLDLIVNGRTVKTLKIPATESQGRWIELEHAIDLPASAWIAARAHSKSPGGQPDAEAHTNPVYVYLNDRAPFETAAINAWLAKIDVQIDAHAKRAFPEQARVLAYFHEAREVLMKIRAHGGLTAEADPRKPAPGPGIAAVLPANAPRRLRTPFGISERDVTVANTEVSDEDHDRSRSYDRGDRRALMAAAPALVAQQLEESRARYPTLDAWRPRRAQIREEFLKAVQLWPLPARAPLNPIVHSRREHDGYSVENIAIEAMPGFFCTGNLYRPLKAARPGPGILCPHGHFQPSGRYREEHQIRSAHLARMGATVFSYSMVGYHDSRQTSHRDPIVLALQTLNALAAIDYLSTQPGVDPQRIGITGASGGGSQTVYAALIDDRVTASCNVGIVYQWMAPLGCMCETGLPITQAADTNGIELSAAIAPQAQLYVSIGGDGTRDFPQTGFPFVRGIYELHGRAHAVRNVHLPEEKHDFGPSKRHAMYVFFAEHLGMTPRPEDAATIAIERPRQMEVFGPGHPHPPHALQGTEAIGRAFEALPRIRRSTTER